MSKSLYETLEVDTKATQNEIKNAYRNKAKKSHPDKGGDKKEFTLIAIAYRVLSDSKKREYYDRTGSKDDVLTIDKKADGLLQTIFSDIIKKFSVEKIPNIDVIKEIKESLNATLNGLDDKKKKTIKKQKSLEKIIKKIKHKDVHNSLSSVIEQEINNETNQIKSIEEGKEIVKIAKNKIKDYKFKFDDVSNEVKYRPIMPFNNASTFNWTHST